MRDKWVIKWAIVIAVIHADDCPMHRAMRPNPDLIRIFSADGADIVAIWRSHYFRSFFGAAGGRIGMYNWQTATEVRPTKGR